MINLDLMADPSEVYLLMTSNLAKFVLAKPKSEYNTDTFDHCKPLVEVLWTRQALRVEYFFLEFQLNFSNGRTIVHKLSDLGELKTVLIQF